MDSKLEAAVRYLKHIGCGPERPNTEFQALTGLGRRIVENNRSAIDSYFKIAQSPSADELGDMEARLMSYLFSKASLTCFKDILGVLCGYLLIYRSEDLKNIDKCSKVLQVGKDYADVLLRVLSRKDYSVGVPIHSSNKSLVNLKKLGVKQSVLRSYFSVNDNFYPGRHSKRYTLTDASTTVLTNLEQILRNNLLDYVHLLDKHMQGGQPKSTAILVDNYGNVVLDIRAAVPIRAAIPFLNTKSSSHSPICLPTGCTSVLNKYFLYLSVNDLVQLSLPSLLHVMSIATLAPDGKTIIVPLRNLSSTDPSLGRHYNIFTRLRSAERKALGYYNYDISGGIQIISFGILHRYGSSSYLEEDDLFAAYPMIFQYGYDPDYKKDFRERLSDDLEMDIGEVKALLTAYANGSNRNVGEYQELEQFKAESDLLRREVIAIVEQHEPAIRKKAEMQSRHSFPEDYDWENTDKDDDQARQKSSVYFFIWTYFEKQIRDAMLSLVDDGIPVHDAIYSKQQLPFSVFEQAILDQTGFELSISH